MEHISQKSEVAIIKTLACREDTEKKTRHSFQYWATILSIVGTVKKKQTKALISILGHYTIV